MGMQRRPDKQHDGDGRRKSEERLDERLAAYYSPMTPPEPAAEAWQRLRAQLGSQSAPPRRMKFASKRRRFARSVGLRRSALLPRSVQDAYERVAYEARSTLSPSILGYQRRARLAAPAVRISLLRRRKITLLLPAAVAREPAIVGLEVLMASGLARYQRLRTGASLSARLLLLLLALLICAAALFLWQERLLPPQLLIAMIVPLSGIGWLWHMQRRALAFEADRRVVLWLGRRRTCQGLHALADCARSPRRGRWGEPSLQERIARVCGVATEIEDEQLTLVR